MMTNVMKGAWKVMLVLILACFTGCQNAQPTTRAKKAGALLPTNKAAELAPYAMMAANSYHRRDERFPVEQLGWHQVDLQGRRTCEPTYSHRFSLAYDIYRKDKTGEVAFVFRGTDSLLDFVWANFAVGISAQYRFAQEEFDKARGQYRNSKFVVVGHSLGGGMALAQSVHYGIDAVVFDPSPRIFDVPHEHYKRANCQMVFEKGEILDVLRRKTSAWSDAIGPNGQYEVNDDFHIHKGPWFSRAVGLHSMTKLACAILDKGAKENAALRKLKNELPCPICDAPR